MIYTLSEYSKTFLCGKKKVSKQTIIRRIINGQLPTNHIPYKLPVRKDGAWVIEVRELSN
jgi:hypothetical protein